MPPAAQPQRQTRVLDIRTGDQVLVLTGKDAGKKGTVTKVLVNPQGWKKSTAKFGSDWQRTTPLAGAAVVVDGVNVAKRHTKPRSSAGPDGPSAARPAGRHPGHRDAAQHQQRHGHLPFVLAAHAGSATGRPPMAAASGSAPTAVSPSREWRRSASERAPSAVLTEVVPALQKEFEYGNAMQVPRLTKIVVNIGMGEALRDAKAIDAAVDDLTLITGQKPVVTRAKRSIAQFRVRTGNAIGVMVTLRGERMWDFLERLTRIALPRIRDFRGVPSKSFDGRGNYSLGLREQLAFPEIDYDRIDRLRGLEVSIVTTATNDEESKRLLALLGMPFAN